MATSTLSEAQHPNLVGLGRTALAAELAAFGAEPFRARQLWHWIYHRGATDFATMTSLSKAFREELAAHYALCRPAVSRALTSVDGTRKWLLRFADGQEVETVHIPEEERGTLCVSSQVGCTLSCTFCHTGTQRLVRNLTAAEIVAQIMIARDTLGEWPSPKSDRQVTNIVLMGMGEPLFNYDNIAEALKIVMDPEGLAISRRKITLSTAGVVPAIRRCGAEIGVNLAVSLHAVRDDIRDRLVPLNRKYPIAELLDACRSYPGASNARRITFEYVMLKGVNDSAAEARELVRLLAGIPAKVNPRVLPLLGFAVVAYAALVGGLYLFQRQLLYFPDRARPELFGLEQLGVREATLMTEDGLSLLSWYLPARPGRAVIAYFHGNGGHIGYRAERLLRFAREGYGVLMAEYRGYGSNPGTPSEAGFYADGRAALAFLDREGVAPSRVVLYGESLGSGVAVALAVQHEIGALILDAPPTSVAEVAQCHFPYVPASRMVTDRFDSLSRIGNVRAPILVLHGEHDRVVPVRYGRALFEAAPEPKEGWFAPEAGHEDLARYGSLDVVVAFIERRLGG